MSASMAISLAGISHAFNQIARDNRGLVTIQRAVTADPVLARMQLDLLHWHTRNRDTVSYLSRSYWDATLTLPGFMGDMLKRFGVKHTFVSDEGRVGDLILGSFFDMSRSNYWYDEPLSTSFKGNHTKTPLTPYIAWRFRDYHVDFYTAGDMGLVAKVRLEGQRSLWIITPKEAPKNELELALYADRLTNSKLTPSASYDDGLLLPMHDLTRQSSLPWTHGIEIAGQHRPETIIDALQYFRFSTTYVSYSNQGYFKDEYRPPTAKTLVIDKPHIGVITDCHHGGTHMNECWLPHMPTAVFYSTPGTWYTQDAQRRADEEAIARFGG